MTTIEADLRFLADRRTIKPVFSDSDRAIFVLPRGAREVRLVSRAQSPTEARPWLEGRRRLGESPGRASPLTFPPIGRLPSAVSAAGTREAHRAARR